MARSNSDIEVARSPVLAALDHASNACGLDVPKGASRSEIGRASDAAIESRSPASLLSETTLMILRLERSSISKRASIRPPRTAYWP